LTSCKHFDGGLEFWNLLTDDLIELDGAHSGLLQLFKWSACFDALMLPRITDQPDAGPAEQYGRETCASGWWTPGSIRPRNRNACRLTASGESTGREVLAEYLPGHWPRQAAAQHGKSGQIPRHESLRLRSAANDRERRGLARSGETLDALNAIWRTQHIFNYHPLSAVEVLVSIGHGIA
jgi:hypothetical protein